MFASIRYRRKHHYRSFHSLRFASITFDICLWCFWTCLHYRGMCCSWRCLHYRGLSCIWTCLHYRGVYCSWRPELHLDVSALQRNVLLLEVSKLQGPELYLDVSALQRNVLLLEVFYTTHCYKDWRDFPLPRPGAADSFRTWSKKSF